MSAAEFTIREAEAAHGDAMLALIPRLADYDAPTVLSSASEAHEH
jgi:hypothetical protein